MQRQRRRTRGAHTPDMHGTTNAHGRDPAKDGVYDVDAFQWHRKPNSSATRRSAGFWFGFSMA